MFFTYLRRELRRRRKAALVVASGLALGIALVIVVDSVSSGMNRAQGKVLESLYGLGTDLTVTKAQERPEAGAQPQRPRFEFQGKEDGEEQSSDRLMVQGFQTLADSTVGTVARQQGVDRAVGGLSLVNLKIDGEFKRGQVQRGQGQQARPAGPDAGPGDTVTGGGAAFDVDSFTIYGTDVTAPDLGPLTTSTVSEGRTFKTTETNAEVAVVDSAYAQQKDLSVGDELTVKGVTFGIVGIATADRGQSAAQVYLPLKQAQTLSDSAGKITTIYVKATDSTHIDAVKTAIQKNVSGTTVTTSADLAQTVSGSLDTAAGLASDVGTWLSYAVLLAAVLVAGLLTSSAVGRRVREFGTLKALGWKSGRVTRQVVGEALVNGVIGGALGIAIGLAGAYAVTAASPTLTAELGASGGGFGGGRGGGMVFGGPGAARTAAGRTVDIALTAPVSVTTVGLAVLLALGGGLVAGAFGAWRASRLRPADALRRVE
ncbi:MULTISPECIES: ABC transporter permease [Streptomyces]|uniref:ABC-type lipoprotein release transport system permease subunit n=1 Tax=Streptomyces nymphaeiformis TaxID=2663842 RepID=A0A7W7XG04_9ACTN|nr:ABC transporter permease [Streptomyces nymphaeiformis]MBB4987005.1 ABC-type lipoprotein release transport system permease subunit [Streptomyces nymphaeiformis]